MKIKNNILRFLLAMLFVFVFVGSMALFAGCSFGDKTAETSGKHVVDPTDMGGEGVLDDGGKINHSGPTEVMTGVKVSGERRIVLGLDDDKYQLNCGAKLEQWSGVPNETIYRCRITNAASNITFTLDFSDVEDTSKIGCMVTLIRFRAQMTISVSSDGEEWTEIGYPDRSATSTVNIRSDYAEQIHDLRNAGYKINDSGLWQFYWNLGDYIGDSGILYLRAGYSDEHSGILRDDGVGTDIIDHISYFKTLDYVYEML